MFENKLKNYVNYHLELLLLNFCENVGEMGVQSQPFYGLRR